jgi:PAS domain S-box-containing protein
VDQVDAAPSRGQEPESGSASQAAEGCDAAASHDAGDPTLTCWAFEQSPFASAIHDPDLRYTRVNARMAEALGRSAQEILGARPAELMPGPEGERIEAAMRRAVQEGEPVYLETRLERPDQGYESGWSGQHYFPLKDPAGRVRAVYAQVVDIGRERRARQRLILLNETSDRVGSTLDVRTTAEELAQVLVPAMADFVTVDLLVSVLGDQEPAPGAPEGHVVLCRTAQRSVLEGCPEAVLRPGETEDYPEYSPHARSLATGRSFLTPLLKDPGFEKWAAGVPNRVASSRSHGIHSAMVVPLRARGTTLGVAVFTRHRQPLDFDTDDLLLAEELTAKAAVSIDNALRYTRQQAMSLALQNSLLPQSLPQQAALEVAGCYLPSDSESGVGGDWYDVIPLAGARVALVVGDVVGHGIHASAAMGRLRTAVRTLADIELPPDELLAHLDDLVTRPYSGDGDTDEEADRDIGATCLYAVYDPVSHCCTMAAAGHLPPAVVWPDGRAELIDLPVGPPLGVGGLPFEKHEIQLPEGSLLALCTDGLVERRGRDVDEGIAELLRTLAGPSPSPEETRERVLASALTERAEDDIALLLARTRALDPNRVAAWTFPNDPAIVAEARECTVGRLHEWGLQDIAFTTELIISELVTNAVRYASGPINVRLIWETHLICEVSDPSKSSPQLRRARTYDEGGRGLLLVAQLSRRWGTRPTDTGKIVWAEQTAPTGPAGLAG